MDEAIISEERYTFLVEKAWPIAKELQFYSADFQLPEKLAFLHLMGIEELLFFVDESPVRAVIVDCPKYDVHLAACGMALRVQKEIRAYRAAKKAEQNRGPEQLDLEPTGCSFTQPYGEGRTPRDVALLTRYGRTDR